MDEIKIGSNRSFGIVFFVVFLLIALYPLLKDSDLRIWSLLISLIFLALGLSNSARAGLTGYVAGTSRQVAEFGVTINNLQPGVHDTDRIKALDLHIAEQAGITISEAKQNRLNAIPAKRYGTIHEFGAACAFLCSQQAGFIIGQNILLDGGAINSTM